MKNLFQNMAGRILLLFTAMCAVFVFSTNEALAQAGNTGGPVTGIDLESVCWILPNGEDSTLYIGFVTVVGEGVVDTIGHINANGDIVDISAGGSFQGGPCDIDGSDDNNDSEYVQAEICDNAGNKYVRIFKIEDDGTITVLSTIDEDGNTGITVNQPVEFEWCNVNTYESPTVTRFTVTTTSILTPLPGDGRASIEIINVGHTIATLSIDGAEEPLLPSERFYCHTNYDHVEMTQRMCNSEYIINANGGTVRVVQRFED